MLMHNGKSVGEVVDRQYITIRQQQHFFKIFQGFGISVDVIRKIRGMVDDVVFLYHGKKGVKKYVISFGDFMVNAKHYVDGSSGKDDPQLVCPIGVMSCDD